MITETIKPGSTMHDVLAAYPGAQRALFRRYHIGGCSSCGFQPTETLEQVCQRNNNLGVDDVLEHIKTSHEQDAKIMLSPEDKNEMTRLRAESAAIGRQMRDIQYQRNKDVERIGATLKFINIGLMPVLVGVAAVGLSAYRANRRRAWSHTAGART